MVGQAHVSEENNLGSHGIQKGSIMGDHNHRRGLQRLQIALQHAPDLIICMHMTHQPQDAALIFSTSHVFPETAMLWRMHIEHNSLSRQAPAHFLFYAHKDHRKLAVKYSNFNR